MYLKVQITATELVFVSLLTQLLKLQI